MSCWLDRTTEFAVVNELRATAIRERCSHKYFQQPLAQVVTPASSERLSALREGECEYAEDQSVVGGLGLWRSLPSTCSPTAFVPSRLGCVARQMRIVDKPRPFLQPMAILPCLRSSVFHIARLKPQAPQRPPRPRDREPSLPDHISLVAHRSSPQNPFAPQIPSDALLTWCDHRDCRDRSHGCCARGSRCF